MSAKKEIEKMMAEYDQAHDAGDGAKLASFFLDDALDRAILPALIVLCRL